MVYKTLRKPYTFSNTTPLPNIRREHRHSRMVTNYVMLPLSSMEFVKFINKQCVNIWKERWSLSGPFCSCLFLKNCSRRRDTSSCTPRLFFAEVSTQHLPKFSRQTQYKASNPFHMHKTYIYKFMHLPGTILKKKTWTERSAQTSSFLSDINTLLNNKCGIWKWKVRKTWRYHNGNDKLLYDG
jgi:hypothetical protein